MIVLGVTGGIGSGKSTVSELLTVCGIPVYIADVESKRLTNESEAIRTQLEDLFGEVIYSNGMLNKSLLASHIFNDKDKLHLVNQIIHPEVKKDFCRWVNDKAKDYNIVAEESAILLEAGFKHTVDKIITVHAPLDLRIKRVMLRDKCDREKVLERMRNQMSDEERIKHSDFVIVNDDTQSLIEQVSTILHTVKDF